MGRNAAGDDEWDDGGSPSGELACVLEGMPPFRGVPLGVLEDLASRAGTRTAQPGQLFLPDTLPGAGSGDGDDPERRVYVVLVGWCKVVRHLPDGRQAVLDVRGPSDLVGEEALAGTVLRHPSGRSTIRLERVAGLEQAAGPGPLPGAVALTRCELVSIAVGSFVAVAARHPSLQHAVARHLAERVIEAQTMLVERAMPVQRRVVEALARLGGSIRRPVARRDEVDEEDGDDGHDEDEELEDGAGGDGADEDWSEVPALGQSDLAALVGASRETVNRALASLAARGAVVMDEGCPTLTVRSAPRVVR